MVTRPAIPKALREQVLSEFNHLCAICGKVRPHIHHIDGAPNNNDRLNLLPLCPTCHLVDHHNPTEPFDPQKLRLFRRFKDPAILSPKFHPLYLRLTFFDRIQDCDSAQDLEQSTKELIEFVDVLGMGHFYSKRILELTKRPSQAYMMSMSGPNSEVERQIAEHASQFRLQLRNAKDPVTALCIELLRYQNWHNPSGGTKPSSA